MVSVTVTQSKRAPIELKFPGKKEDRVLVPELKSAITAKIPKVCVRHDHPYSSVILSDARAEDLCTARRQSPETIVRRSRWQIRPVDE